MTIKAKLQVSVALIIIVALLLGLFLWGVSRQAAIAVDKGRLSDWIVREVFELTYLASDYLLHPTERSLAQWQSQHTAIKRQLEETSFTKPEEIALLERLRKNHLELQATFTGLNASSAPELRERLTAQLLIGSQAIVTDAAKLTSLAFEEEKRTRNRVFASVTIFLIVFTALNIGVAFLVYRGIARPLTELHQGTKRIAAGNLDYHIAIRSKDELGRLAASFNEMSSRLAELDKLKNDFINIAAHDLRTPITAVKGFTQMIRRGEFGKPPDGEVAEALADIEQGADWMIGLVNDFLAVSRMQQGRFTVNAKTCNIGVCLNQAVKEMNIVVKDRPIELKQRVAPDLPEAICDTEKIVQVLMNLIDNSLKHTEKGLVAVTADRYDDKFIKISVTDTGNGIAKEDIPHLFQQYRTGKIKEVAPGRGAGLGLGLHTVKMIIERHGGKVWVESKADVGTTFHFTLPISHS